MHVKMNRRLASRLGLLFLIVLLIAALGMIPALRKRQVYHFKHTFSVSSPAFRHALNALGDAMTEGNRAELFNNGDELFPAMLRAIRGAKASIDLESYIFKDDRTGRLFAQELIEAARRGVEVRLLVDGKGGLRRSLRERLERGGVDVHIYHPIRPWTLDKIGQRTHRKILVVDGATCFTGGAGISDKWLGNARNPREWREVQVAAQGPVVAQMQAIFSEDWTYTTGEILAGDKIFPDLRPVGTMPAQAIKVSRGDSSSLAKMLYYVAIQSAERSIHLQNAYFLPDLQVRRALIEAARRGVDVRVMVPGRHIDVPLVRMASRSDYGELLLGGVKIYEYAPTMLHCKTAVVDGIFCTVGSINFDSLSMGENAEESLAVYDRGFGARLEANFAQDLKRCREVTYETWNRRGPVQRLGERFSWFFEPFY